MEMWIQRRRRYSQCWRSREFQLRPSPATHGGTGRYCGAALADVCLAMIKSRFGALGER